MHLALERDIRLVAELDAFSGRPNPVWQLTGAERNELAGMLLELPAGEKAVHDCQHGLGYRGILVRGSHKFGEITVRDGFVQAGDQRWIDVGRSVEWFLLQTSRSHVDVEAYEKILAQAGLPNTR